MDPNTSWEGTNPPKSYPKHFLRRNLDSWGNYIYNYTYRRSTVCMYVYIYIYIYIKHNQSYIHGLLHIIYTIYKWIIIHIFHINDIHIMEYSFIICPSYITCGIDYIYHKSRIHIIVYSLYDERWIYLWKNIYIYNK